MSSFVLSSHSFSPVSERTSNGVGPESPASAEPSPLELPPLDEPPDEPPDDDPPDEDPPDDVVPLDDPPPSGVVGLELGSSPTHAATTAMLAKLTAADSGTILRMGAS